NCLLSFLVAALLRCVFAVKVSASPGRTQPNLHSSLHHASRITITAHHCCHRSTVLLETHNRPQMPKQSQVPVLICLLAIQSPACAAELGSQIPVAKFTNITKESGISFTHNNGAHGDKLLPETMGG